MCGDRGRVVMCRRDGAGGGDAAAAAVSEAGFRPSFYVECGCVCVLDVELNNPKM